MADEEKATSKPLRMSMDAYKGMSDLKDELKKSDDKALRALAQGNDTSFLTFVVNEGVEAIKTWVKSK